MCIAYTSIVQLLHLLYIVQLIYSLQTWGVLGVDGAAEAVVPELDGREV